MLRYSARGLLLSDRSVKGLLQYAILHEFKKHEDEIDYAEIEACYDELHEIDDYLVRKEFRLQLSWRETCQQIRVSADSAYDCGRRGHRELIWTALREAKIGSAV